MRRLQWGSFEHQQREIYARNIYTTGAFTYFGDGALVMCVCKSKSAQPWVEVIGEDGHNIFGEDFKYSDYFPPED